MPKKIRVYELGRELGLTNKEALDLCIALGIGVKSHSSSIEDAQADRVRRKADAEGLRRPVQPEEAREPRSAPGRPLPQPSRLVSSRPARAGRRPARRSVTGRRRAAPVAAAAPAPPAVAPTGAAAGRRRPTASSPAARRGLRRPRAARWPRRPPPARRRRGRPTAPGSSAAHRPGRGPAGAVGTPAAPAAPAAPGAAGRPRRRRRPPRRCRPERSGLRPPGSRHPAARAPGGRRPPPGQRSRPGAAHRRPARTAQPSGRVRRSARPASRSRPRPGARRSGPSGRPDPPAARVWAGGARRAAVRPGRPAYPQRTGGRPPASGGAAPRWRWRARLAPGRRRWRRRRRRRLRWPSRRGRPVAGAPPRRARRWVAAAGGRPQRRRPPAPRNLEELEPTQLTTYTPVDGPVPEGEVIVERGSTAQDLGPKLNRSAGDVVRFLLLQGEMVTATQSLTDDMIELFAAELGAQVRLVDPGEEQEAELQARYFEDDDEDERRGRPAAPAAGRHRHGPRRPRQDPAARPDPLDQRGRRRGRRHHPAHRRLPGRHGTAT